MTKAGVSNLTQLGHATALPAHPDEAILERVATRVYEVNDGACKEVLERRREPTTSRKKTPIAAKAAVEQV